MDAGAYVLIIEFVVFLIGIPTTYVILRKLFEDDTTSDTLVILHDGSRTNGKTIGPLVKKEVGKDNRVKITFKTYGKNGVEFHSIIAEHNRIISHPKGVRDSDRNIIEVLPNSAQEYYNNLFQSIEIKGVESHIINAQREGINRAQIHLDDMGEGEVSALNLALQKDFVDSNLKQKDKAESGKFNPKGYPTSRDVFGS